MYCYVHIPFCNSKCKYCRFASLGKSQNFMIQKYLGFLIKEIENYKTNSKLKTIYFGGGTPSTISILNLERIINTLKKKFSLEKNIEITLETTPDNVNLKNLISREKIGINRISIGIQTLNNKSLLEIGRGNNKIIFKALDEIKKYLKKIIYPLSNTSFKKERKKNINKITNFSIDFIIGLPYVKSGETKKNIEFILKKYDFIKHISVYLLEDYYNSNEDNNLLKIEEKNNFEKINYPDSWENNGIKEEEYLGEYLEIQNFLENSNFKKYEISNFGKKDFECKHNIAYWNHKEVIGFGLSASSLLKNSKNILFRKTNSANFLEYYSGILEEKIELTKNDIFLEKVMFGLRTSGLEKNIYKNLNTKKIQFFIDLGFLKIINTKLVLSDKGVLVLDYILKEII